MPFFMLFLSELLNCNISFTTDPNEANCWTHGGNFHADDIFCNIFFGKYLEHAKIYRSGQKLPDEENKSPDTLVYDVGYGELDHHQKDGNGNHLSENNKLSPIPYASFGLVWEKFGHTFCDKIAHTYGNPALSNYLWNWMEDKLVLGIDSADNGIYPKTPDEYENHRILTISNTITLFTLHPSEPQNYALPLCRANSLASLIFDTVLKHGIWNFEHVEETHSSVSSNVPKFHAHEIFCEVALKRFFPDISEEGIQEFYGCYETEIFYHPLKRFDTIHEKEPIPTSPFGILWERAGKDYCKTLVEDSNSVDYLWNFVKNELVIGIDAHANEIRPTTSSEYVPYSVLTIYEFIDLLNPLEYSIEGYKFAKKTALLVADAIFERVLQKALDRIQTREYIEEKINSSKGHILILDRFVHWQEWIARSTNPQSKNLWFVIFPSNKGIYNIQPIPCKYNLNGYRKGFPSKWYGCNEEELREITKVPTATFVHSKGFIGGAEDLAGAISMAEKAFSNNESIRIPQF